MLDYKYNNLYFIFQQGFQVNKVQFKLWTDNKARLIGHRSIKITLYGYESYHMSWFYINMI